MQDPTAYGQLIKPQFPEQEQLRCPRCDSINTKFCYYNNYNLSQPRHFCKNCRRYWTKGGTLRNIPVGGGTRKISKRPSNNSKRSLPSSLPAPKAEPVSLIGSGFVGNDQVGRILDMPAAAGSFTSLLLASNGQFGNLLLENGPGVKSGQLVGTQNSNSNSSLGNGSGQDSGLELQGSGSMQNNNTNNINNNSGGDSSCCGWPNLAIYTPDSRFQ